MKAVGLCLFVRFDGFRVVSQARHRYRIVVVAVVIDAVVAAVNEFLNPLSPAPDRRTSLASHSVLPAYLARFVVFAQNSFLQEVASNLCGACELCNEMSHALGPKRSWDSAKHFPT